MPAKTEKQRRAMHAAAAGKSTIGIPQSVGREFVSEGIPEHKSKMKPSTSTWKKPKSGGKPKRIRTKNPPGGSQTPGAKQRAQAKGLRKSATGAYGASVGGGT